MLSRGRVLLEGCAYFDLSVKQCSTHWGMGLIRGNTVFHVVYRWMFLLMYNIRLFLG